MDCPGVNLGAEIEFLNHSYVGVQIFSHLGPKLPTLEGFLESVAIWSKTPNEIKSKTLIAHNSHKTTPSWLKF